MPTTYNIRTRHVMAPFLLLYVVIVYTYIYLFVIYLMLQTRS